MNISIITNLTFEKCSEQNVGTTLQKADTLRL